VYARKTQTDCCVLSLPVTNKEYRRVKRIVKRYLLRKDMLAYNYLGILGCVLNRPIYREGRYFCSQFVATVLEEAGIRLFEVQPGLVRPRDFRVSPSFDRVYAGRLCDYRKFALGV
ncbi:MAG: hypothetical protein IJP30_02920, partial [Clostridia bacterium]|nr:hypothetical protein [Clostridia bacterium]